MASKTPKKVTKEKRKAKYRKGEWVAYFPVFTDMKLCFGLINSVSKESKPMSPGRGFIYVVGCPSDEFGDEFEHCVYEEQILGIATVGERR